MANSLPRLLLVAVALLASYAAPLRASTEPPVTQNFFSGEMSLGDIGNDYTAYYLPYFNTYAYQGTNPIYVYKFNFGFLYYFTPDASLSTDDAYFYDFTESDYFYTSSDLYPYFYSFNKGTYLYYFEGSNPRDFYDFGTSSFINY